MNKKIIFSAFMTIAIAVVAVPVFTNAGGSGNDLGDGPVPARGVSWSETLICSNASGGDISAIAADVISTQVNTSATDSVYVFDPFYEPYPESWTPTTNPCAVVLRGITFPEITSQQTLWTKATVQNDQLAEDFHVTITDKNSYNIKYSWYFPDDGSEGWDVPYGGAITGGLAAGEYDIWFTPGNEKLNDWGSVHFDSASALELINDTSSVSISSSPNPVDYGTSPSLTWSTDLVNTCTASGGWSGSKASSGTESVSGITTSTTYTLDCLDNNSGETVSGSVVVAVNAPGQCQDGIDNDGDGWTDYPADLGCTSAVGANESDVGVTQCSDEADNDNDSLVDGNDPGCLSANDDTEEILDFTLTKSNNIEVSVVGGQAQASNSSTIKAVVESFSSDIALTVTSVTPALSGATFQFSDTTLSTGEYSTGSALSVTVPGSTTSGTHVVNVKGTGGGFDRTVNLVLTINATNPQFENF